MAASKNTILSALNKAIAAYEYITGSSKSYPSEVKAKIKDAGDDAYEIVKEVAKALKDGSVFEVKNEEGKIAFAIDLGKFFTAGYFTNLVEKNSKGNIKFNAMSYMIEDSIAPISFTDNKEYEFDLSNAVSELNRILKPEADLLAWDGIIPVRYIFGYISINLSKIMDLMPGMISLTEEMAPYYDETTGNLKMPFTINAWINICKPLDTMEGQWFQIEYKDLSDFFDSKAEDDYFVNIVIKRTIRTENSTSSYTGVAFAGDVKTIKESGFVTYGIFNEYYPTTLGQYLTKSVVPGKYAGVPDEKGSADSVKLYVYSNMSGDRPGNNLDIQLHLCKKPISNIYSSGKQFVAYYDSEKNTWSYGYAKNIGSQWNGSAVSKVE